METNAFKGVVPALITPMTAAGALHEEALRRVMEFNIAAGVHGFWVAGGTGESILLSDEENRRIAEIAESLVTAAGLLGGEEDACRVARRTFTSGCS